jgi:hypothetical protein
MGAFALWETGKSCGKRPVRNRENVKQTLAGEEFCCRRCSPLNAGTKKRAWWKTTGFGARFGSPEEEFRSRNEAQIGTRLGHCSTWNIVDLTDGLLTSGVFHVEHDVLRQEFSWVD